MIYEYLFLVSSSTIILFGLFIFFTRYLRSFFNKIAKYISMLFYSTRRKEGVSLLIDIGNGNMTGGLVSFNKNQLPRFINSTTISFTAGEKLDASKLVDNMKTLLDSLLSATIKQGVKKEFLKNKKLNNVLVTFSSPWFILKTKNIHLLKDTPFVITRKFIDDIVSKEEELFKKDLLENYPEDVKNQFDVIEKSVIHTRINGYIVNDSIGRKTRVFDANIFMSAIVKDVRERIINIVLKHTHISPGKILMHTFPLVLFSTIRDNFTNDSDFILMDITSEITDVALVSDDVITKTNSFPFGRNSIIRQIAKVFNVSLEIAESTLHMYMSSKVDDTTRLLMQNLFNDMEKEWEIYFKDMLLALSPNIILPKDVYITADSDVAPIFVDFLKLPKKDITTNFRKNINITHVSKDLLSPFYTNDSKMQEDEFITILAIFYNKLLFL